MTPGEGTPRKRAPAKPGVGAAKAPAKKVPARTSASKAGPAAKAPAAAKPAARPPPTSPTQPAPSRTPAPPAPPATPVRPQPAPSRPASPWTHIPANVHYVPIPRQWAKVDDPLADRLTRTDLRLALVFFLAGTVAVFLYQMPLIAQVVVGAPLFEEMFKLGLALLPCAALRVRSLALRLPFAAASGIGFGLLEHTLSYSEETAVIAQGRMAFHGLSTVLSMLVLHGLSTGDRRLRLACTLPSSFIHAGNNTAAVALALADAAGLLRLPELAPLAIAGAFVVLLALASLSWPAWREGYRVLVERYVLARLGPPTTLTPTPSTSSRS